MKQLNVDEYLYIMSHLKCDDDVELIYSYLLKKNFFTIEYINLTDQQKIESAQLINELCNEDASSEDLMILALSRCYSIPFDEVKQLPASIGRYLIRSMQEKLQFKESTNNNLTNLIKGKVKENTNIYKSPDAEILNIFKKQFGKDFNIKEEN